MESVFRCRIVLIYSDQASMKAQREIFRTYILAFEKFLRAEVHQGLYELYRGPDLGDARPFDCYSLTIRGLTGKRRELIRNYLKTSVMLMRESRYCYDCYYEGYPYKMKFSFEPIY